VMPRARKNIYLSFSLTNPKWPKISAYYSRGICLPLKVMYSLFQVRTILVNWYECKAPV
jgi:hypothetical protein